MFAYIIRRLIQMGFTLFVVSVLSFLIVALAPGDPYAGQIDPKSKPIDVERQRDKEGFDDPVLSKYISFYKALFTDFATAVMQPFSDGESQWELRSIKTKEPILPTMWDKTLVTLPLVIVETLIIWTLAFPLGIYSALKRNTTQDRVITFLSFAFIAIPGFWIAIEVVRFVTNVIGKPIVSPETMGVELTGVFSTMDRVWHMAVPAVIAALGGIAVLSRYVKGQMLEVMGQDYIRTAKAKGLSADDVTYKHALRNASLPFITMLAGLLPSLFGGSVVFEAIYGWPGLGRWFFEAVFTRDIFIVLANLFVGSALTLIGVFFSDLLYGVADPRVRLS
ncbi:MAG: ABC transporter permease [Planctomycetes bacterium]|nr:ABC transporter permease [Planctomycetota bacterium]